MTDDEGTDKLLRALSLLTALQHRTSAKSIREYGDLTTSHVDQFHTILKTISSIGIDVSEFFIPEKEVQPRVTSQTLGPGGGRKSYSEDKYVLQSIFLTKLEGIINYLKMLLKEGPRKTGFQTPK